MAITPKITEQITITTVEFICSPPWLMKYTTRFIMAVTIEHITPAKNSMKKR